MQEGPKRVVSPALATSRQHSGHAESCSLTLLQEARSRSHLRAASAHSAQRWLPARAPDLFTNSPAPGDPAPAAPPRGPLPLAAPRPPAQRRAARGSVLGPCARPVANRNRGRRERSQWEATPARRGPPRLPSSLPFPLLGKVGRSGLGGLARVRPNNPPPPRARLGPGGGRRRGDRQLAATSQTMLPGPLSGPGGEAVEGAEATAAGPPRARLM